jgi:hypothetical protein
LFEILYISVLIIVFIFLILLSHLLFRANRSAVRQYNRRWDKSGGTCFLAEGGKSNRSYDGIT